MIPQLENKFSFFENFNKKKKNKNLMFYGIFSSLMIFSILFMAVECVGSSQTSTIFADGILRYNSYVDDSPGLIEKPSLAGLSVALKNKQWSLANKYLHHLANTHRISTVNNTLNVLIKDSSGDPRDIQLLSDFLLSIDLETTAVIIGYANKTYTKTLNSIRNNNRYIPPTDEAKSNYKSDAEVKEINDKVIAQIHKQFKEHLSETKTKTDLLLKNIKSVPVKEMIREHLNEEMSRVEKLLVLPPAI